MNANESPTPDSKNKNENPNSADNDLPTQEFHSPNELQQDNNILKEKIFSTSECQNNLHHTQNETSLLNEDNSNNSPINNKEASPTTATNNKLEIIEEDIVLI